MGSWIARIYLNKEYKTQLFVNNSTTLKEIKNKLTYFLKDENFHFLSNDGIIITDEINFTAKNIYKTEKDNNENKVYNIYLVSESFLNKKKDENIFVNVCINDYEIINIKIKENEDLNEVLRKIKHNNSFYKNELYFLSKSSTIIKNNEGQSLENVLKKENDQKIINVVSIDYYQKLLVIKRLNILEKQKERIDWELEGALFENIKDFAGVEIVTGIIDEIFKKEDICENSQIKLDKQMIKKLKELLKPNVSGHSQFSTDL